MIAEQADSPDKISVVNKSPNYDWSINLFLVSNVDQQKGGLVIAVPPPNRSTVKSFKPLSCNGAKETQT